MIHRTICTLAAILAIPILIAVQPQCAPMFDGVAGFFCLMTVYYIVVAIWDGNIDGCECDADEGEDDDED